MAISYIAISELYLKKTLIGILILFRMIREPELQEWVLTRDLSKRINYRITPDDEEAIDRFLFTHYCNAFRQGAFARANSSMCVKFLSYSVQLT